MVKRIINTYGYEELKGKIVITNYSEDADDVIGEAEFIEFAIERAWDAGVPIERLLQILANVTGAEIVIDGETKQ